MFFESRMRWFAAGVGVGDAAASSGIGSSHSRSSGLTARRPRATLRSILNGEGGAPVALPPRHERRATLRRVAALRAPRQRPWRRRKRCCRREPTRAPQGCGASSARPRWCRQGGGRGAAGAGAARAQPADTACAPPRAAVGAPRPSPPRGARSAHLPLSGGVHCERGAAAGAPWAAATGLGGLEASASDCRQRHRTVRCVSRRE